MFEKNLNIGILFDVYAEMLTQRQRDVVDLYYNADLSLSEIAEITNITRQGVRDSIKKSEAILLSCENNIGFISYVDDTNKKILEIIDQLENLKVNYFDDTYLSNDISVIIDSAKKLLS